MDRRSLLRKLYRELRPTLSIGQKHVYDCKHWKYIMSVAKTTKEAESSKLVKTAENYLSYLEGTRKYTELMEKYKGTGERSADDLAHLMGFKMPNEPREDRRNTNNSENATQ